MQIGTEVSFKSRRDGIVTGKISKTFQEDGTTYYEVRTAEDKGYTYLTKNKLKVVK